MAGLCRVASLRQRRRRHIEGAKTYLHVRRDRFQLEWRATVVGNEVTFDTGFGGEMQFNFLTGGLGLHHARHGGDCRSSSTCSTTPLWTATATSRRRPRSTSRSCRRHRSSRCRTRQPWMKATRRCSRSICRPPAQGAIVLNLAFTDGTAEGSDYDSVSLRVLA